MTETALTTKLTIATAGGATYSGYLTPAEADQMAEQIRTGLAYDGPHVHGIVDINPPSGPRCIIPMDQITMVIVEHKARPA